MKFNTHIKNNILTVICYLFVLLFVYAAASKLLDFNTFQNQLGQSPLLSAYAHWVVWAVPLSEILIAILLCINRFRVLGIYGFYGLMVMFTTYIVIILNFTSFTPCSCGGVLEKLGWTEHLVFNIFFIILSALSIVLLSTNKIRSYLKLFLLTIFSSLFVTIIFLSSEKQIKRNNAFIRRYMPHPIEKIGEYDLKYNSYYIAGIDDKKLYLGNYTAPLTITTLDNYLQNKKEFHIAIDSMQLPYSKVRVKVQTPYFFVGDGTIPILFKGKINDWQSKLFSYDNAFFNEYIISDSTKLGITTISSGTMNNTLGLIHKVHDSVQTILNKNILKNHSENIFYSNGMMQWNDVHQKFLYIYFYKNRYEILDKNLSYISSGVTIDTISKPVVDVAYYKTKKEYTLGANTIMVNLDSATYGDYLYIHSDRKGKYEEEDVLNSASIIDVYDITNNNYLFSFYLYHQPQAKLTEFIIHKNILIAIVDSKLWVYHLKPEYFSTGFNSKYTAQYQESD